MDLLYIVGNYLSMHFNSENLFRYHKRLQQIPVSLKTPPWHTYSHVYPPDRFQSNNICSCASESSGQPQTNTVLPFNNIYKSYTYQNPPGWNVVVCQKWELILRKCKKADTEAHVIQWKHGRIQALQCNTHTGRARPAKKVNARAGQCRHINECFLDMSQSFPFYDHLSVIPIY